MDYLLSSSDLTGRKINKIKPFQLQLTVLLTALTGARDKDRPLMQALACIKKYLIQSELHFPPFCYYINYCWHNI